MSERNNVAGNSSLNAETRRYSNQLLLLLLYKVNTIPICS